jgi:hypothetical protein
LTLDGTAVVHTNFLGVIGISQVDISSKSVSTWGNTRLRVALVLDNTGLMADAGKMDAPAIGLQVGWQTLTAVPFTVPAIDPDYKRSSSC